MNKYRNVNDYIEYMEDVNKIVSFLKENDVTFYSHFEVYYLWRYFSDEWSASFLSVSDNMLKRFLKWIRNENWSYEDE